MRMCVRRYDGHTAYVLPWCRVPMSAALLTQQIHMQIRSALTRQGCHTTAGGRRG